MKKIFTLLFAFNFFNCIAQPVTPATTPPARNTTDYVSLYSGVYNNITGTDFYPGWGQSTQIQEFYVGTDTIIKYSNFNYQGIQLAASTDVSNMTKLHLDLWTSNCTAFEVFLINTTPAPAVEQSISLTPTLNGWNSFDIDLSLYTNIALHNIGQIKMVSTPFGGSPGPTVYIDNIYFYKPANVPTITNFSIPSKAAGANPFNITAPTSNSSGAFSYTSTNTSVATVSGNTITVVGVGTTTIKAVQAANGSYASGTISTTFAVSTGLANIPTTAAPTPTKAQANVISLYSNAYTNVPIDTWSAVWDQADIKDTVIAGDSTKRYTNLVYSGIEFTGSKVLNVTNADYFHVDIWTPNATVFKVKLVDFGANGTYGGGDDKEHEYTVTPNPALSSWVSIDIPMTAFTGLTTKAHLAQMLFVSNGSTVYFDNVYFWANTAVLPVDIKTLNLSKSPNGVVLNWTVGTETNLSKYIAEKSTDGINFEQFVGINAANKNQYSITDQRPSVGVNYYRIKFVDVNGKFGYSATKNIDYNVSNKSGITVYPNPSKGIINISNLKSGSNISVADILGKTLLSKTNVNTANYLLDATHLSKGVYSIIINNNNETNVTRIVIQ